MPELDWSEYIPKWRKPMDELLRWDGGLYVCPKCGLVVEVSEKMDKQAIGFYKNGVIIPICRVGKFQAPQVPTHWDCIWALNPEEIVKVAKKLR